MIELLPDGTGTGPNVPGHNTGMRVCLQGKALNQRVGPLREYNIPESRHGRAVLFATAFLMIYLAAGYRVNFELQARDVLLVLLHHHRHQCTFQ